MRIVLTCIVAACMVTGCQPRAHADTTAIASAALTELFVRRENARSINLWLDSTNAPVFGEATVQRAIAVRSVRLAHIDTATLVLPIPVKGETLSSLETLFRDNPIGWDAFFRIYAGSAGVVELTVPQSRNRDGDSVVMFVGRTCGEHCKTVWRIALSRAARTAWRVDTVLAIALPRF